MNLSNKPSLQMSPGQSGSGSPWSLFEDQVIVVLCLLLLVISRVFSSTSTRYLIYIFFSIFFF